MESIFSKKSFYLLLFILYFFNNSYSSEKFVISDYSSPLNLAGKKIIRFKKGDDPDYKNIKYNDSSWMRVSLPSNWNDIYPGWTGVSWYRIHIEFPDHLPERSIGLQPGVICDVDEVFFNGRLIGKSGKFPPGQESAYSKERLYEIPPNLVRKSRTNVIAMRISGLFAYCNGPYRGEFILKPFHELIKDFYSREFLNLIFLVIYIVVSFYFALFYLRYPRAKENLYFSLFMINSAVYFFLRSQIKFFVSDNFLFLVRLEFCVISIIFVLLMEFITSFFKQKRGIFHYIFYVITASWLVFVIFTGKIDNWDMVLRYALQPSWIIPVSYCVYILVKYFKSEKEAKYLSAAFAVLIITIINDILVTRVVYDSATLTNYGFLVLVFSITIIINNRFIMMKKELEELRRIRPGLKKDTSISNDARKKLEQAISIINYDFSGDISRETIAKKLAIHPDYLGKLFKQYTGKKFNDYVNECRIEKAKILLREKEYSVINIAYVVGFDSLPTFYRVFQKNTGESPTAFRQKNAS